MGLNKKLLINKGRNSLSIKRETKAENNTKISVKKDGLFIGYKSDTFWTISKTHGKNHKEIAENLVNNLLSILNSDFIKYYPFKDAETLTLELVNDSGQVKETVTLIKNSEGKYQILNT